MEPQRRAVPVENGAHRVILHPGEARRGVDFRPEVLGKEAVALQATRRHKDKDAEGGVREAKPGRRSPARPALGKRADQQVDFLDVAVDFTQFTLPIRVVCKLLEAFRSIGVNVTAERAVAGYAPLAVAENVD